MIRAPSGAEAERCVTSRREFLKVGLVASTLPVAAVADLAAADDASPPSVSLYKVLYDTRFAASVAFARRASARGLDVQAMGGDMTRFWYEDLYHRWRKGPAAIAGLTAHGPLFCLERLAWEQRMRVVFRGEHALAAEDRVAHRLEGAATFLPAAVRAMSHPAWAGALADVVASCPAGRQTRQAATALTASAGTLPASEALYSWVIAPWTRS
jgi:hypothetical protein